MKFLTAIVTVSLVIMITASAGYYFYNNSINESSYPSYHVDMYLNTTPYYPIHLNSNLTGNGTYQQLLTFSDPSIYGINSQGSNVLFYASNGTELYAWLQSINSTSAQYWVKNYYGNSVVDMQVLPEFENLFNANGYLGYGREYFNAPHVFVFATDFSILSGVTILSGANYVLTTSGLQLYSNEAGNILVTNATFQINGTRIISNLSFNPTFTNTGSFYPVITSIGYITGDNPSLDVFNDTTNPNIAQFGNNPVLTDYPYNINETYMVWHNSTYEFSAMNGYNKYQNSYTYDGASSTPIGVWANQPSPSTFVFMHYLIVASVGKMPTFTIGSGTNMTDHVDASYLSNSITIPIPNWFNLTLKAYTNYSFTFQYNNTPLYFTYDGLINNTIYTGFFDHNLTLDIHFIALGYSGKTQSIVLERG